MRTRIQKIGLYLFLIAFVLALSHEPGYVALVLLTIGILDLILMAKNKRTISQVTQDMHEDGRKWIDKLIMIGLVAAGFCTQGIEFGLAAIIYVVVGHLFWNE